MNSLHFRLTLLLVIAIPVHTCLAQVVISSFTQANGQLTWTNSTPAPNYTYRIEWASTPDGPWAVADALAHLTNVRTTNSVTSTNVPTFFRVVWTDAPAPLGLYNLALSNNAGGTIATGLLTLESIKDSRILGFSDLKRAGPPGNQSDDRVANTVVGRKLCTGVYNEGLTNYLTIHLNGGAADDMVPLIGQLSNREYWGRWRHDSQVPFGPTGTFGAIKLP